MILGPIQEEDKKLIQSVILMTCPSVVVEFGTNRGESALAILEVLQGKLYSFDIDKIQNIRHPNFIFIHRGQETYNLTEPVDIVFFDGAHNLELNIQAYLKIEPYLTPGAIIIVHDTGTWKEMFVDNGGYMTSEGYIHQPDERKFVNWLTGWNKIHFHTHKEVRHGITLLQRNKDLLV
jgi:predicted O-methyltransferase YrrM